MSKTPALPRRFDSLVKYARPSFLYVIYAIILWALPVGMIALFSPASAAAMTQAMTAYLSGIPDGLLALFGSAYLGYTAARQWGKVAGVDQ
jgi:hypothetical protein